MNKQKALREQNRQLRDALDGMVKMYVDLVESGDAGFWDAEKVAEVVAARAALALPDA